ncbi:MAG: S8 family peptidase [Solirubrobacteraceae bacterium]
MRLLLPLAAAVALIAAAPAAAQDADPTQGVRIAVIDTGINIAHQEFAPDQLVGYWDFTTSTPDAGQTFDPNHAPADGNGHGTLTSSMAAGLNVDPDKTPSFAPGFKLAMADVGTDDGTISGDIAAAIRWSVETIHADVINISIGSIVPIPGAPLLFEEYVALQEAREAGVLVTVANGNGTANAGLVPGDGASSTYASSQDVLAVGASGIDGATVSYQPEVAAQFTITGPTHDSTDKYVTESGTSFSSPLVAGFAARLIAEARAAGRVLRAPELEALLKSASNDTELPPTWEGYGVLDAGQLPGAIAAARAGTLVERPSPDLSATYVEQVAGSERALNNGELPPLG